MNENAERNKAFIKRCEDYANEHGYFCWEWFFNGLPEDDVHKENDMAGFLNDQVQEWYKNNTDLLGVIEKLTNRCKKLEEENTNLKDENEILKDEFDIKVKVVKEQNDYICKIDKRCGDLEKKADLANAYATNWQHKFFVESAKYDELIDKASKLDLDNYKLKKSLEEAKNYEITRSQQIENLKKEIESQKQMAHNRKRYDYIHHFDHVNKLSCRIKDLEKEVEKYKNEVRNLNAACKAKNDKIKTLKKALANKGIRIANNVTEPYCEVSYVFDNGYYHVDEILEVCTNETD